MTLFALSDLHLSLTAPWQPGEEPALAKPMDVFGPGWQEHFPRLLRQWQAIVGPEDTVLLAGDLSWAMTLEEARFDLDLLGRLPGRKIIVKGNHDFWWASLARVREALPAGITALQHSAVVAEGWAVAGTRGWLAPGSPGYKESEDRKLFQRELLRLEMALAEGAALGRPLLALVHYPPLDRPEQASGFCDLLSRFKVRLCLYGHIHGEKKAAFEGWFQGVEYRNCSSDRLDFRPLALPEAAEL